MNFKGVKIIKEFRYLYVVEREDKQLILVDNGKEHKSWATNAVACVKVDELYLPIGKDRAVSDKKDIDAIYKLEGLDNVIEYSKLMLNTVITPMELKLLPINNNDRNITTFKGVLEDYIKDDYGAVSNWLAYFNKIIDIYNIGQPAKVFQQKLQEILNIILPMSEIGRAAIAVGMEKATKILKEIGKTTKESESLNKG